MSRIFHYSQKKPAGNPKSGFGGWVRKENDNSQGTFVRTVAGKANTYIYTSVKREAKGDIFLTHLLKRFNHPPETIRSSLDPKIYLG